MKKWKNPWKTHEHPIKLYQPPILKCHEIPLERFESVVIQSEAWAPQQEILCGRISLQVQFFFVLGAANLPPSGIVSDWCFQRLADLFIQVSHFSDLCVWKLEIPQIPCFIIVFFGTTSNFMQFVGIPECYAVPSLKRWRHWVRIIFGMFWAQCQPWEDRGHMQC